MGVEKAPSLGYHSREVLPRDHFRWGISSSLFMHARIFPNLRSDCGHAQKTPEDRNCGGIFEILLCRSSRNLVRISLRKGISRLGRNDITGRWHATLADCYRAFRAK